MALILAGNGAIQTVAGTNAIQIDSSSRITFPGTPHFFGGLYGSSAGTLNIYTRQNTGLSVNSNNTIYIPIAGVYLIAFNTITASSDGRIDINLYINGYTYASTLNEANGSGYHYRTSIIAVRLSVNDYVQVYQSSGTPYYSSSTGEWSTFSMVYLG